MAKDEQVVNKEILTEAITLLGKSFNQPKPKHIEQAIALLKKSTRERKEMKAVRADVIQEDTHEFWRLGVLWIDTWLRGGLRPGELVLIGATPHAGKTHTLAWFGIQFLLEGFTVLSIIGEDLLGDIKACYSAGVQKTPEALEHLWLADMQDVRFGARELDNLYDQMVEDGNAPDIVIVDHVDLMKGNGAAKSDWEVVTDVMVDLKMFAKRTGTIVITASQINFSKEQKGMDRFYRSKVGKAGNADVILMIDDVIDNEYWVSLTKARGRKRIPSDERQKVLLTDWDRMQIEDIT